MVSQIFKVTEEDFHEINFGINLCKICGHEFIFQSVCEFDKKRRAQNGPVAIIDNKYTDVENFDEALVLFNATLNSGDNSD